MRRKSTVQSSGRTLRRRRNPVADSRTVAAGVLLTENPNRGKRHAAPLAYMDGFIAELATAEQRAYSPLTVTVPVRDSRGRKTRHRSRGYTI